MESLAFVHHTSGIPGAQFITTGELKLKQTSLLRHSGRTTTYNVSATVDIFQTSLFSHSAFLDSQDLSSKARSMME